MAKPTRRESVLHFKVSLSHHGSVEVSGFHVGYYPQESRPVQVRGTIGFKINDESTERAVRAAQEMRPKLAEVGVALEEDCSRRGNGGGRWGTMEYDFEATYERTRRGFKSPEDAVTFISNVVSVLGCEPLGVRGTLFVTHCYDILTIVDGKRKWVREEDWLIGRTKQ